MKFNKKYKIIFLDPHTDIFDTCDINESSVAAVTQGSVKREKVNVILSPSLYWVKKLSLPVKYARDAKKLLPSIFEDVLPEGNYSYSAYKKDDEFFVFAYEDKSIIDCLDDHGISASNVANVYFAQSELENIDGAKRVNDTQSIYLKDELLVMVPTAWIDEYSDLEVSEIELSNNKVTLHQFGHIVDNSSLYKIGAILVILIILVATEYFITTQKTSGILKENEELFAKYNLKSTMIQNKSMLKKYKNIHDKQTKLREYTSYILNLNLKKDEKLSHLILNEKTLTASISGVQKKQEGHIINALDSKKVDYKAIFRDDTLHLEMKL